LPSKTVEPVTLRFAAAVIGERASKIATCRIGPPMSVGFSKEPDPETNAADTSVTTGAAQRDEPVLYTCRKVEDGN